MDGKSEFIIEYEDKIRKTFDSYQEAYDWVIRERDFWGTIVGYIGQQYSGNFTRGLRNTTAQNSQLLPEREGMSDEDKFSSLIATLINHHFPYFYHHESPEGLFLRDILENNNVLQQYKMSDADKHKVAAFAFSYLKNIGIDNNNGDFKLQYIGFSLADEFMLGDQRRLLVEKQSFDDVRKEHNRLIKESTEQMQSHYSDFASQMDRINRLEKIGIKKFKRLYKATEQDCENLREKYEDLLKLKSSVTYWERQKAKYNTKVSNSKNKFDSSIRYTVGIIFLSLAAVIFAAIIAPDPVAKFITDISKIKPLLVGAGGLVLVLIIWMIRMNARMYISNQHLYDNAEQREIMIQTFLAMKNEDEAISEEDKAYILGYLFKSTGDGLVKDEGVPSPLVDILTKVGQK